MKEPPFKGVPQENRLQTTTTTTSAEIVYSTTIAFNFSSLQEIKSKKTFKKLVDINYTSKSASNLKLIPPEAIAAQNDAVNTRLTDSYRAFLLEVFS